VDTPSLPKFSKGAEPISKNVGTGGPPSCQLPAARGAVLPCNINIPPLPSPALPPQCFMPSRANLSNDPTQHHPPLRLSPGCPTHYPTCAVVYMGKGDEAAQKALTDAGITVHSFADFLETGRGAELTAVPPKPDDVCCIMYTRWARCCIVAVAFRIACKYSKGAATGGGCCIWGAANAGGVLRVGMLQQVGGCRAVPPSSAALHLLPALPGPCPCPCPLCSGTTGTPKGVMTTHKNYVSGVAGARNMLKQVGRRVGGWAGGLGGWLGGWLGLGPPGNCLPQLVPASWCCPTTPPQPRTALLPTRSSQCAPPCPPACLPACLSACLPAVWDWVHRGRLHALLPAPGPQL
jgi:hypothetical protein